MREARAVPSAFVGERGRRLALPVLLSLVNFLISQLADQKESSSVRRGGGGVVVVNVATVSPKVDSKVSSAGSHLDSDRREICEPGLRFMDYFTEFIYQ